VDDSSGHSCDLGIVATLRPLFPAFPHGYPQIDIIQQTDNERNFTLLPLFLKFALWFSLFRIAPVACGKKLAIW
jgi:hypothetical protein